MSVWNFLEEPSGGCQPDLDSAFATYPYGAPQPVGKLVASCVGLRVVSYNFGMPQSMMQPEWRWNSFEGRFRDTLQALGHGGQNDFVFCSAVGAPRHGFREAGVVAKHVVQEPLPGAACQNCMSYLNIWNVRNQATGLLKAGVWEAKEGSNAHMVWQAYDLTYRDAAQRVDGSAAPPAARKVGLVVGNMHVPVDVAESQTQATLRKIVQRALNFLSRLEVEHWAHRRDFQVVRLLVGNCSLEKRGAEAVTQMPNLPPLTDLQMELGVRQWQVRGVQFPAKSSPRPRRKPAT